MHTPSTDAARANPWPALWALVLGFFMILLDSTIVNVANPAIMAHFGADYAGVIWVTSAYLLAYAVPLLVTGRLGDRYGPRRVYLVGLTLFTLASLACGLSGSLPALVAARGVQGLGASMMSPQSMAVITRLFPPDRRGVAMGVWGSVAGVAMLVGPILGGVLVDTLGWEWIFFVNVPVGLVAWWLAVTRVPALERHEHRFDILGVVLSTVGLFLVVFGLQEGQAYHWGTIWGPITVWGLVGAGIVVLGLFVLWQARNPGEPLLPLVLLRERNFSLANTAVSLVGMGVASFPVPFIFYLQDVRGISPTLTGVLMMPSAIMSMLLARMVGRRVDSGDPRTVVLQGLGLVVVSLAAYMALIGTDVSVWWLLVPSFGFGTGMAHTFGPISTIATRALPQDRAGAGAGIYNTTRQVGSVMGSAAVAGLISWRTTALGNGGERGTALAMAQSLLLPLAAFVAALAVALFLVPKARLDVGTTWPRLG